MMSLYFPLLEYLEVKTLNYNLVFLMEKKICQKVWGVDSMNIGKSSQLVKYGFGWLHIPTVIWLRISCFDFDFGSLIKLTKRPSIHCFGDFFIYFRVFP